LNQALFKKVMGVPKIEKIPATTEFQEFHLRSGSLTKKPVDLTTPVTVQFKARKLNKKILAEKPRSLERSSIRSAPAIQFKEFKLKSDERG
jgi:hypothetical protein